MNTRIKLSEARDVDRTNAYNVIVLGFYGETFNFTCNTNEDGEGLWIDGRQVLGTSQFSAGDNPREAIRRYLHHHFNR